MCATVELEVDVAGVQATYRRRRALAPKGALREAVENLLSLTLGYLEKAQRSWFEARDAIKEQMNPTAGHREATVFQFVMQQWCRMLDMVFADGELVAQQDGREPSGMQQARDFRVKLSDMLADVTAILEARERQIKEIEEALTVRRQWMLLMGVPEDEVRELCQLNVEPSPVLAEEQRQLEAAQRLKVSAPSYSELLAWSAKRDP